MITNIKLNSPSDSLVIAANNTSEFTNWLRERLAEPEYLTQFVIRGIMYHYDKDAHEGVISRDMLVGWLWERRGQKIECQLA